jgi:hypothetical protein
MPATTLNPAVVLTRAADLRAEGARWSAVAAALGVDVGELKALCRGSEAYQRAFRFARREAAQDRMASAIRNARRLLLGDDHDAALRAAELLAEMPPDIVRQSRALVRSAARSHGRADQVLDGLDEPVVVEAALGEVAVRPDLEAAGAVLLPLLIRHDHDRQVAELGVAPERP